jgi:hypothetical protein
VRSCIHCNKAPRGIKFWNLFTSLGIDDFLRRHWCVDLICLRRERSLSCLKNSLPLRNRDVHYPVQKIIIWALNCCKINRVQILTPCILRSKSTLLSHLYPGLLSSCSHRPVPATFSADLVLLSLSHCNRTMPRPTASVHELTSSRRLMSQHSAPCVGAAGPVTLPPRQYRSRPRAPYLS